MAAGPQSLLLQSLAIAASNTTLALLEQLPASRTWSQVQMGVHCSLQTGLRYAQTHGFQTVVTIDAEGRYEVEELPTLLAQRQQADMVVAYFAERNSLVRRIAWQWFRWLTGFGLRDFVSGFRLYNRQALEVASSTEATMLDYQDIGTLLLMRRQGLRIAEVALPLHTAKVNRSKIFRSWGNAVRYVAVSSLLSIAHGKTRSGSACPPSI